MALTRRTTDDALCRMRRKGRKNLYLARARRFVRNPTLSADDGSRKADAASEIGDFAVVLLKSMGFSLLFGVPPPLFHLTSLTSPVRTVRIFLRGWQGMTSLPFPSTALPRYDRSTPSPCCTRPRQCSRHQMPAYWTSPSDSWTRVCRDTSSAKEPPFVPSLAR
jgi:hypothetical protein